MADEPKTYTRFDIMKLLGVHENTVKALAAAGYLIPLPGTVGSAHQHLYDAASVEKARRRLYPEGMTYMQIATKYGLSRNTVKKYVREAKLHPLGFHHRLRSYVFDPAQIADLAQSQGWQESATTPASTPDGADAAAF